MRSLLSVPARLLEVGGSVLGIRYGTEEPGYTVVQQLPGAQIRRYGPRIAAETAVAAGEEAARTIGFGRLARYIFGSTHPKIAMTAPVSQRAGAEGRWVIRFFMPADKTFETLPEPDDDQVKLVAVEGQTVAVRRFSGSRSGRAVAGQTAELMRALRDNNFEPAGDVSAWFYDPPWTVPMLRRNEVAVPVMAES